MAKLVVTDQSKTYLVDLRQGESVTCGRSVDCDLTLDAPRASRRHVGIEADGAGHRARDLGSTNGTLLNGAPLADRAPLGEGDVLMVGGARIVYLGGR